MTCFSGIAACRKPLRAIGRQIKVQLTTTITTGAITCGTGGAGVPGHCVGELLNHLHFAHGKRQLLRATASESGGRRRLGCGRGGTVSADAAVPSAGRVGPGAIVAALRAVRVARSVPARR